MSAPFNLSRWALKHIPLVRYLMAALLIGGILSFLNLGQDEDPPFTFRAMVVSAKWPGASAMQMADQVADKLEKTLQETPYVDSIRSFSRPGETTIIIQLAESTPPKETSNSWYHVRKKMGDIRYSLPPGVLGPFFNDQFGDTYGSIFALSSDGFSYAELKDYADLVRQELLRVPQVAKVELLGLQDEKINVVISHKKLAQLGISLPEIIERINAQNAVTASGVLATPTDNINLRVSGQFNSLDEVRALSLGGHGRDLRLGDIAEIIRGYDDPPNNKMRHNGQEVIGLAVSMRKGGNIIELGKHLNQTSKRIGQKLPVGIELHRVADQPKAVASSVNEFLGTLAEALIIVLAVSFIALGVHKTPRGWAVSLRPGLVVGLTIPLVLAITFLCMRLFNIDLHKISLGALIIALGLLVDDAIIAAEMMVRKMEEGFSRLDAATFAYTSTAMPMLTGTLITAAGFLPIGLAKSAAGEYTFSMFSVNAIALIVSWFVAVAFTPYIGYLLLRVKPKADRSSEKDLFTTPFYSTFRRLVERCVEYRKTTIALSLATFILGLVGFRFVEQQFFPDSNRLELMVELWLPEGASYTNMERQALAFEAFIQQQPQVEHYTSFIGTGAPRFYLPQDQILPQTNVAQIVVLPKDLAARNALREKITQAFATDFPEVRGRVRYLPSGPPVPYPVQFRITGPEPSQVRAIAAQVKELLRGNPNCIGVNDNWNESIKVLRLDLDQDKLRAVGLTSELVMQASNTILSGLTIGQYRENNRLIAIQIRQPLDERDTIERLNDTNIPTQNGGYVTLSNIARAYFEWEPGLIWRENREWAVTVQADVKDGIQGPTVSGQIIPLLEDIKAQLPLGYAVNLAGAAADSSKAQASIAANVPLVIFIIFTLLMLQLHSFSRSVLVFLTGPLGVAGAALALLILQRPFGFVAQLGVIALFGMIIRNSIILIDQIEQDIARGEPAWNAVVESAVRRLRPILLTAAAAVLAMIPLSRSIFWGPMAVSIMGGLIIATGLTLLFLPALYAVCFKVRRPV